MTDDSADLALLTAWSNDLQSQMMIAEAHDDKEDRHWMAYQLLGGRWYENALK